MSDTLQRKRSMTAAPTPQHAGAPDLVSSSATYAGRFAGQAGAMFLERQTHLVGTALADKQRISILDVGGGHGQLVGPLRKAGHNVTMLGSRVPDWIIDSGRENFVTGSLASFPFADRLFDTVVSIRLIGHVADWRGFLAELCRVANRTVVIDFTGMESINIVSAALFPIKKWIEGDTRRYRLFWTADIVRELKRAGFAPAYREGQWLLPMALHRVARGAPLLAGVERLAQSIGLARRFGNPVVLRADRIVR